MDDNKGTSVVLMQSQRGGALLERISERLILKQVTLEETSRQNQAMLKTSQPHARRTEALGKIRNGQIGACESWFIPAKPTAQQRIRRIVRRILNRFKRVS